MTVKEYKKRLWDNLRVARRNLKISQIVASERIGKAKSTIGTWESHKGFPRIETFLKICELYEVKPEDMLSKDLEILEC
ncbi:MAG: helix-turn-helix transcriptional regulator [Methanobrevibacter sp.]|nr:helix-turn-helix transcriptional regulator [Methanobrevibacter sp.]